MNTTVWRRAAGLSLIATAAALAACASKPAGDGGNNPRTVASVQLSSAAGGEPQPNPWHTLAAEVLYGEDTPELAKNHCLIKRN